MLWAVMVVPGGDQIGRRYPFFENAHGGSAPFVLFVKLRGDGALAHFGNQGWFMPTIHVLVV